MKNIWLLVKGMFIGIANIVPGLSGGTIAVSLGIYDDIIHSVTKIKSELKKSIRFLLPILLGAVIAVAVFSRSINYFFDYYPLQTASAFTGLILGGLPILWKEFQSSLTLRKKTVTPIHWLIFLAMFALIAWMGVADASGGAERELSLNLFTLAGLMLIGMIASASMVIPGVSGSLVMLILGWYQAFLSMINGFIDALRTMNMEDLLIFSIYCAFFGIGLLIGVGGISKSIDLLFTHFPGYTYAGIFGLVLASPIAIFSNIAIETLSIQFFSILLSVLLALMCFILTYLVGSKSS